MCTCNFIKDNVYPLNTLRKRFSIRQRLKKFDKNYAKVAHVPFSQKDRQK